MSNLIMPTLPDLDSAASLLGSNFREIWRVATGEERKKLVSVLVARAWVKGKRIDSIEPRAGAYYVLANAESKSPVGSACVIKFIPTGAHVNAHFCKVRQWAHEEIPQ